MFCSFGAGPVARVPHVAVHHAFEVQVAANPHAVAVEHLGDKITYAELERQANRLAARLAQLGVRPGDNVALFVQRSIAMVVGIMATLKVGRRVRPAGRRRRSGAAAAPRGHHRCDEGDLDPVGERAPRPGARRVTRASRSTRSWPSRSTRRTAGSSRLARRAATDGCYVLFTSGTTGTPNGVTVTHRNVCNILLTTPGDLGIQPGWRVAQILNVAFDMAAWEVLGCLSHGATLVIRGADITETVRGVDVVIATPTVLGTVDPSVCASVKVVAVAGEPCPRPLADRWASMCTFYNACGPTETTIVNTMQRHDPAAIRLSIGRPTPNNTVYVLDDDLRPCAIGEVGEMWAGGDCVSAGYLHNDALNAERYAPDPFLGDGRLMFRTRDLGRWTPDGELEHLGRTDDQVKVRGGFRVELDSVSAVLETVTGCHQAVTLKVDDELVSFVAPADVDPALATEAVASALPYYCTPTAVHPLPVLPRTSRGKVDKAALRALAKPAGRSRAVAS